MRVKNRIIYIIMVCVVLSACSDTTQSSQSSQVSKNTIKPAEINTETKNLMSAAGADDAFVFDFSIEDQPFEYLSLYIDHYEKGVKKEKSGGISVSFTEQDPKADLNRIVYAFREPNKQKKAEKRTKDVFASVISGGGMYQGTMEILFNGGSNGQAWGTLDSDQKIMPDEPITLAYMIQSSGNSIEMSDRLLTLKDEEFEREIAEYEHVYLFRAEFTTENPHESQ